MLIQMNETAMSSSHRLNPKGAPASLKYFRAWAALLFLVCFALGSMALFTFGFACFASLSLLWLKEPPKEINRRLDSVNGAILIIVSVWFFYNLVLEIVQAYTAQAALTLFLPLMSMTFLFPPLIMQSVYYEHEPYLPPNPRWRLAFRAVYPVSLMLAFASFLPALGAMKPFLFPSMLFLQMATFALFCVVGIYGIALSRKSARRLKLDQLGHRRWNVFLYGLTTAIFVLLTILVILRLDLWAGGAQILNVLSVFARSLPLCFFFVGSYYERRFAFFDIFIKRGTFFFLVFVALVVYLSALLPFLNSAPASFPKPRLFALFLLPLLLVLPLAYRLLERFLDRAWLGRSFSPVEAMKYFLTGIQEATSEAQLIGQAEARLSEVFQAEARVILASVVAGDSPPGEGECEVALKQRGEIAGVIRMGGRANDTPYFSADLALLSSLADVFCSLLDNVRLQQKKLEQDKREQTLMLHASRSELKALRAQVNPHFLFNALNAIAGLIHTDPAHAEGTVEQLSEVFRYTLKRSEKETVRIEDELDFVRSYLEVERARFGERLQVRFDVHRGVEGMVVPTMTVQTLVENAVKHGVASVRGVGIVEVRVDLKDGRLCIEVLDNGPGFSLGEALSEAPGRSGYGLKNLKQRLESHYGSSAEIRVGRDEAGQRTVVTLELPSL